MTAFKGSIPIVLLVAAFSHSSSMFLVNDSLTTVRRILDLHRNPRLAEDVDHQYSDKYVLVEQMANTALIARFRRRGNSNATQSH